MVKTLFKETFYYFISKAIPGIVGFISVLLFIRILGSSGYGQYSLFISQCNLIAAISFGWINQSQLRYFSKYFNKKNYNIIQIKAFAYSTLASFVLITLFVLLQSLSINILFVSIIVIIGVALFNYLKTLFQAKILPFKIIWFTSGQSLLALIIPICLLIIFGKKASILLFGIGLSFLIPVFIMYFTKIKKIIISKFNFIAKNTGNNLLKKWFLYGSPLSLWFAAGLLLPFLDRYFINKFLLENELGIYSSIQEILVRFFSLSLFPLIMAIHPRIMNYWNNKNHEAAIKLMLVSMTILLLFGIIIILVFIKFDGLVYYGFQKIIPEFNDQFKPLLLPILISGFLWQISLITHKILEIKEKTLLMVLFIIPSLIINMVGNIIFLPTVGLIATAYTSLFSALSYSLITLLYSLNTILRQKLIL